MLDDADYLKDFLKIVRQAKEDNDEENKETLKKNQKELNNESIDVSKISLNRRECNVLYKIAGHLLHKITGSKKKLQCSVCLAYSRSSDLDKDKTYTILVSQPNLKYNSTIKSVFYINENLFKYFVHMEKVYRIVYPILHKKQQINLGTLITDKLLELITIDMPQCHNLRKIITKRFVMFRLKNSGLQRERTKKFDFSSHTMN